MLERVRIGLNAVVGMALVLSMPVLAQNSEMPAPETGTIMGTHRCKRRYDPERNSRP